MDEKLDNNVFYEAQINNFLFRYKGEKSIEITRIDDKTGTLLREIPVNEIKNKKEFEAEISFWFMKNGSTLSW